jgi:SAM-dependent methyltransferase
MNAPSVLIDALAQHASVRRVEDDIWTVMSHDTPSTPYDGRAQLYDRLIGSRIYNRVAWGADPAAYEAFAQSAVEYGIGTLLDAGCGTLVSTARVHARSERPTILVDLSIDMLRAARARLLSVTRRIPDSLVLLQADMRDLPFRDGAFGAVLCPGMLHLFDDLEAITRELSRVSDRNARIFASSLVAERWIGRRYLSLLHRAGEVAQPRRGAELLMRLNGNASGLAAPVEGNRVGSMVFVIGRPA